MSQLGDLLHRGERSTRQLHQEHGSIGARPQDLFDTAFGAGEAEHLCDEGWERDSLETEKPVGSLGFCHLTGRGFHLGFGGWDAGVIVGDLASYVFGDRADVVRAVGAFGGRVSVRFTRETIVWVVWVVARREVGVCDGSVGAGADVGSERCRKSS